MARWRISTARAVLLLLATMVLLPVRGQQPNSAKNTGKGEQPPVKTDNKNTLIKAHRDKLKLSCSTFFGGWPVEKILDDNIETSWFSATGDTSTKGTKPWVQIDFPVDVVVARVTILGNREPSWLKGYTILDGLIEFFDADGKKIWVDENTGVGNERDFEFKPKKPMGKVRSIRFTSLKDQGDQNPYDDIAIGEVLVE